MMDVSMVLREVDSWSVDERLRLAEALWDRIAEAGETPQLTEAQQSELDRRLTALDANPGDVVPWEAVEQHVRRPR
jgi:putative addiction module component (TIGR02574 family)